VCVLSVPIQMQTEDDTIINRGEHWDLIMSTVVDSMWQIKLTHVSIYEHIKIAFRIVST